MCACGSATPRADSLSSGDEKYGDSLSRSFHPTDSLHEVCPGNHGTRALPSSSRHAQRHGQARVHVSQTSLSGRCSVYTATATASATAFRSMREAFSAILHAPYRNPLRIEAQLRSPPPAPGRKATFFFLPFVPRCLPPCSLLLPSPARRILHPLQYGRPLIVCSMLHALSLRTAYGILLTPYSMFYLPCSTDSRQLLVYSMLHALLTAYSMPHSPCSTYSRQLIVDSTLH
ncbi:hypothetical protein BJ875DRAFT_21155 [Amylocarpus encephaloides]|uniref:Uncharacterized protein n=1 Tax=Amylocarpus encephaloides TaxID=45428 RepID=A0A9P7YJD9_9HELO|nr:hypothetical protein BJ875DRAFT_21155 [Amylocarpus encephaloides]